MFAASTRPYGSHAAAAQPILIRRCFGRAHRTCRSSNENLDFRVECLELRNEFIEV